MPKFKVTLAAERTEYNEMTVKAATPAAACSKALVEDDGDYQPGDLAESWVDRLQDEAGNELPIPAEGLKFAPAPADPLPAPALELVAAAKQELAGDERTGRHPKWMVHLDRIEAALRGPVPADSNPLPYPDAPSLRAALQWLLDDLFDAGETHSKGEAGRIFDSVEHAARALINAGGSVAWYPGERLAIVDGDENADLYGYASTEAEAAEIARDYFVDPIARVERYGPINMLCGAVLPEAFVAITAGSDADRATQPK